MHKKSLILPSVLITSVFVLGACGSDAGGSAEPETTDAGLSLIQAGTLSVCSDVPYPPFEDFDDTSPTGFSGFDVDVVSEVAERLDLEIEIKDSSFDALQSGQALNAGQCDIAASAMTITEERAANLDFSDGYYNSEQSLLVPVGSDIASLADLDGAKVGVQQGTTGKAYAEENATGADVVTLPSDAEMFQAIKAGQVAALLQDLPVNLDHTNDGEFQVVETYDTDEEYGFAMKKGNGELVEVVNEALAEMRDDGTYDAIFDEYFAVG